MVGQTVTFELGMREINVTFDGMLFINMGTPADIYPTNDLLDLYTQAEVDAGVLPQPVPGDYNGNGRLMRRITYYGERAVHCRMR